MNEEISIIIPTWNSMPEFERCLNSIPTAFPEGVIKEIIVVDKHSTDGTIETAKKHGCTILYDDISLGSARMKGLHHAKTERIAFIDSDIELPDGWFDDMLYAMETTSDTLKFNNYKVVENKCSKCEHIIDCWTDFEIGVYNEKKMKKLHPEMYRIVSNKIGWIYGRTIDDREPIKSEKLWKMQRELGTNGYRLLKEGDRAYTNNTLCLREPLLNSKIEHLNAWEDYILTQNMLKAGYNVVEVPITCNHLRSHTYDKFGVMTEAWGIAGEIKAKGWNPRTLARPFWFLYWGTRCTIHFKDFSHFKYNLNIFLSMIKAMFINRKQAFEWKR